MKNNVARFSHSPYVYLIEASWWDFRRETLPGETGSDRLFYETGFGARAVETTARREKLLEAV